MCCDAGMKYARRGNRTHEQDDETKHYTVRPPACVPTAAKHSLRSFHEPARRSETMIDCRPGMVFTRTGCAIE